MINTFNVRKDSPMLTVDIYQARFFEKWCMGFNRGLGPFNPFIKIHKYLIHVDILSIYLLKFVLPVEKWLTIHVPKFNDVHVKLKKTNLSYSFYKTHRISNKFQQTINTSVVMNEQFLYIRNQNNYYILELKCFWNIT